MYHVAYHSRHPFSLSFFLFVAGNVSLLLIPVKMKKLFEKFFVDSSLNGSADFGCTCVRDDAARAWMYSCDSAILNLTQWHEHQNSFHIYCDKIKGKGLQ